uniref:Uncharacterized protein n=1 Tax=Anguilla anguilla TaxID=7936 RepID=A0A0E9T111_ANGAN
MALCWNLGEKCLSLMSAGTVPLHFHFH